MGGGRQAGGRGVAGTLGAGTVRLVPGDIFGGRSGESQALLVNLSHQGIQALHSPAPLLPPSITVTVAADALLVEMANGRGEWGWRLNS